MMPEYCSAAADLDACNQQDAHQVCMLPTHRGHEQGQEHDSDCRDEVAADAVEEESDEAQLLPLVHLVLEGLGGVQVRLCGWPTALSCGQSQ